jgi:hypothetical protein
MSARNRTRTTRTTAAKPSPKPVAATEEKPATETTPEPSTTATTAEEKPEGFNPAGTFEDDSRIIDPATFGTVLETVSVAGMAAYRADVNAAKSKVKLAASLIALRVRVLRKDDRPDFEGETAAAKDATSEAMSGVREKLGKVAYRTFMNAVRKSYPAAILPEVVAYVITPLDSGFPEEREAYTTAIDEALAKGEDESAARRKVLDLIIAGPSFTLISAVRKVYRAADLSVPKRYGNQDCRFWLAAEDAPETGGPEKSAPPSPAKVVSDGMEALDGITPLLQSSALVRGVSIAAANLTHPKRKGGIEDRPTVAEHFDRIAAMANLVAKFLHDPAKFSDQDRAALIAAAWSQKDADAITTA